MFFRDAKVLSFLGAFLFALPMLQETPADDNPQVADRIKALGGAFKKKDDDAAIRAIDALTQLSEKAGPKDKGKIAKAVSAAYGLRRDNTNLARAATLSLSTLGDDGAKYLIGAANDRAFKKPEEGLPELRAEIVKAAGRTKSEKAIEPLIDLMRDKDYIVIAAACEALGNYRRSDEATRKKIVERLVKLVTTAEAAQLADPKDTEAKLKYDTIGGVIITSLQALTGESIKEPSKWLDFWNDHKKEPWKPLT